MAIEKTKADRNLDHRLSTERSDLDILTVPGGLQSGSKFHRTFHGSVEQRARADRSHRGGETR